MTQPIEEKRLKLQDRLDRSKARKERNILGQFATPTQLAQDIAKYACNEFEFNGSIKFLDPAIGTGSFYSALLHECSAQNLEKAQGFEIDLEIVNSAKGIWSEDSKLKIELADFTEQSPKNDSALFNLIIANPPYVRHHHITSSQKLLIKNRLDELFSFSVSGLTGLYVYFLLLAHQWMDKGGKAIWLIPSEFMSVKYGASLRHYLCHEVTLHHLHRFDPEDLQFADALVSSVIIVFEKNKPHPNHEVKLTYGGSLNDPLKTKSAPLTDMKKYDNWFHLFEDKIENELKDKNENQENVIFKDLFKIKRGIATGSNNFFIISMDEVEKLEIPSQFIKPILSSPRSIKDQIIVADDKGNPLLDPQLFLIDCPLSLEEIQISFPKLFNYLQEGIHSGISEGYLASKRKPWYKQESRIPAPFLCSYMGRSRNSSNAFKFFWNKSQAIAPNVYLMIYPTEWLKDQIKKQPHLEGLVFNYLKNISDRSLKNSGRVYGGGLHKLEPSELGRLPVDELLSDLKLSYSNVKNIQLSLLP